MQRVVVLERHHRSQRAKTSPSRVGASRATVKDESLPCLCRSQAGLGYATLGYATLGYATLIINYNADEDIGRHQWPKHQFILKISDLFLLVN
jgi:hypothetical protein